jgi:hypothetical protein
VSPAPADRIIVALDGMDGPQALAFSAAMPELRWVKVGLELFTTAGPQVVHKLREQGKRVFLDLKFHDIPATMAGACRSAARLGVGLMTVHACAGSEALRAAQSGAQEGARDAGVPAPTLLAVTVLTSWDGARFAKERRCRWLRLFSPGGGRPARRPSRTLRSGNSRHPPGGKRQRRSGPGDDTRRSHCRRRQSAGDRPAHHGCRRSHGGLCPLLRGAVRLAASRCRCLIRRCLV